VANLNPSGKQEKRLGMVTVLQRARKVIRENGYSALSWKILWKLPILRSLVLWRFAVATRDIGALEDAIEFAFSGRFGGLIRPLQIRSEIHSLCEIVAEHEPNTVLEIGTERCGTLFLFSRLAAPNALLISIDLPREDLKPWRSLCEHLGRRDQKISLIDGDSHDNATVEKLHQVLGDRKVDFLFIDGDHSYDGVKEDFATYFLFMEKHGIVAFHDINPDYWMRFGQRTGPCGGEVYRFWDEIKNRFKHVEFIDDSAQDGYGIGILWGCHSAPKNDDQT